MPATLARALAIRLALVVSPPQMTPRASFFRAKARFRVMLTPER
jgi:hypothetical protein